MKVGMMPLRELEYRLDSKSPMRLVDLRTPEEYRTGHLEGAVNIPFDEIRGKIGQLEAGGEITVFYCTRGGNSLQAARMAAERGIPAYSVANGIIYYRGRHMVRN